MKLMNSRFPGKCAACGGRFAKGDQILYGTRSPADLKAVAVHPECGTRSKPDAPKSADKPASIPPTGFVGTDYHWHHDSAASLAEPADFNPDNTENVRRITVRNANMGLSWYGFATQQAGIDAFRHGWPEGAERLEAALRDVTTDVRILSRKRKSEWADTGDDVDMQRVWSGGIDRAFRRTRRQHRTSPGTVTIAVSQAISSGTPSDQLFWAGAAALRLAMNLENAGHTVEIVANTVCTNLTISGKSGAVTIVAKAAGAPIDLGALAGIVCSGITMRHFSLLQFQRADETVRSNSGISSRATHESFADRKILVTVAAGNITDSANAAKWVVDAARDIENWSADALAA